MGMKSVFCRFPVQFEVKRRSWFGYGPIKDKIITAPLCVREFFPDTFRAAYRQKARWTLGIGLQSWSQIGWSARSPSNISCSAIARASSPRSSRPRPT